MLSILLPLSLKLFHKEIVSNFWQVIDGMDTLDYMEKVPVDKKYRPTQEIKIKGVTIHANPLA
jgi:hypothetical protein